MNDPLLTGVMLIVFVGLVFCLVGSLLGSLLGRFVVALYNKYKSRGSININSDGDGDINVQAGSYTITEGSYTITEGNKPPRDMTPEERERFNITMNKFEATVTNVFKDV